MKALHGEKWLTPFRYWKSYVELVALGAAIIIWEKIIICLGVNSGDGRQARPQMKTPKQWRAGCGEVKSQGLVYRHACRGVAATCF